MSLDWILVAVVLLLLLALFSFMWIHNRFDADTLKKRLNNDYWKFTDGSNEEESLQDFRAN